MSRNPAFVNLEVGIDLVVQFTPEEAKEFIPKLQQLIQEKLEKAEKEAEYVHSLRDKFEENYEKLNLAINPLLSQLQF